MENEYKIAIFEYRNLFIDAFPEEFFDAQIWFFEQDNSIEIRYGKNNFSADHPMKKGPLFNYVSQSKNNELTKETEIEWIMNLGGSPEKPSLNRSKNQSNFVYINSFPTSGVVYRYKNAISNLSELQFNQLFSLVQQENNIYINAKNTKINSINIYNMTGSLIDKKTINSSHHKYDLSNLANGVYILKINSPQGNYSKKIIK